MKKFRYFFIAVFLGLLFAFPALAFPEDNNSSLLKGKILLDSKSLGSLWYVFPGDYHRYYVGSADDACKAIINLALGVSNADFDIISKNVPDRLKGMFIIKSEDAGRIYYIDPTDKSLVYIQNPRLALYLLTNISSYASYEDLKTIPTAKIIADNAGREISRQWQYLGFWGRVNYKYVPAMAEPKFKSKKLGAYSTINRLKILAIKKGDNTVWYQVDGGLHPGAYIEAKFITPIPQPEPEKIKAIPKSVKAGDYWIDLNITKSVLTMFKGDEPVLATYVSTGVKQSPTIAGTFNIYYKYVKTRMRGAPPKATHYYDLPNVPWTMYYNGSFGIHGAYWHDEFGGLRSAGCTNMTIGDSKFVFETSGPSVGKLQSIRATATNPGTVVNNHY